MIVYLNGQFLPEDQARISIFDRGFLYGDGLFETMRVLHGRPFRWEQHMRRLQAGADLLGISIPQSAPALRSIVDELMRRNAVSDALLRLTVSRGCGPRGYSPRGAELPTLTITLHPAAAPDPAVCPEWDLVTAGIRLPAHERLAHYKTCNKLPQVFARAQADAVGAHEALLLNTDGFVVEASGANLFWIVGREIHTSPLDGGVLAGVTRQVVAEIGAELGLAVRECCIRPAELLRCDGVFLSLSSVGIAIGATLDRQPLAKSPLTPVLYQGYQRILERETRC